MATAEVDGKDHLEAVRQMTPEEFAAFLEEAMSLHPRPQTATLSARETRLIERINRGLSENLCKRHAQLIRKQKKGNLSEAEHRELLELTHEAESRDADRAAALVDLAKLRRIPVRALMKQMGIQAAPING